MDFALASLQSLPTFKITPEESGDVKGDASDLFVKIVRLPMSMAIAQANSPFMKEDGTMILRGIIGKSSKITNVKNKNYEKNVAMDDELWDEFKKEFEKARGNLGKVWALDYIKDTYDVFGKKFQIIPGVVDGDISAIGYFEIIFNFRGEQKISSGGIIIDGLAKGWKTYQFTVGPVPVYVEIGGGLVLSADLGAKLSTGPEGVSYAADATLALNPYLFAGAGVGVAGVLSLGVRGTMNLNMQVRAASSGSVGEVIGGRLSSTGKFVADGEVLIGLVGWYYIWRFARY